MLVEVSTDKVDAEVPAPASGTVAKIHAAEGDTVQVELLTGNPGDKVKFDDVLMIGGDSPKFGAPLVAGAAVEGEIVQHGRGPKLIVFKFRKRKRSRRKAGHRQDFTAVKITGVTG